MADQSVGEIMRNGAQPGDLKSERIRLFPNKALGCGGPDSRRAGGRL